MYGLALFVLELIFGDELLDLLIPATGKALPRDFPRHQSPTLPPDLVQRSILAVQLR